MKKIDKFYTPPQIAEKMILSVTERDIKSVADFAVGEGELLRAAKKKWPKTRIIGIDICKNTIIKLRRKEPKWLIKREDFLNAAKNNRSPFWDKIRNKVSLVLLNPPFSCRGGAFRHIHFNGQVIRCSTAFAFVLNTLPLLSEDGQLIAIMPSGCLNNEKDQEAWTQLRKLGSVEIVGTNGHKTFSGCYPRTVIIHFDKQGTCGKVARQIEDQNIIAATNNKFGVEIFRGKIQMHSVVTTLPPNGISFVHSTELALGELNLSKYCVKKSLKTLVGPAVLLPRVGNPTKNKVALYKGRKPIALSDCVIALKCRTAKNAKVLYKTILSNWEIVNSIYGGTCARYTTIKKIEKLLTTLGFKL